jgi:predicted nucleotidyltransferase
MNVKAETYIVIPKNNKGDLQSLAIKRAIGLSLKKAVEILTGKKKFSNKRNNRILEKEIYSKGLKYVYSFKIVKAKKYLNLYYIDLIVYIRENLLKEKLKNLGFKTAKDTLKENKINYNVYYVRFKGNFSYSDSNKFQKLMLKYSRHLQNLYVSSFSEDFAEIKVLYYGSIIRLFKRVKPIIETYLKAKIYPVKNNTIIVDVK